MEALNFTNEDHKIIDSRKRDRHISFINTKKINTFVNCRFVALYDIKYNLLLQCHYAGGECYVPKD